MKTSAVRGCCTAKLLWDFPADAYIGSWWVSPFPTKKQVSDKLAVLKKGGFAIVTAYLTDGQKKSIKLLKSVGFSCSVAATKTRHADTKLFVLSINLDKLKDI